MFRLHTLFSTIATIFAIGLTACQNSIDPNNPPLVILDTQELNIDGGGGNIPIFYSVQNGIKGTKPTATSNVEWVKVSNIDSSTIMLKIEPSNSSEERFGTLTVSYKGMENSIRVYITQDAQLLDHFSFDVSEVTYKSCKVKYIPKDENISYMANIIDKEYFKQSGVDNEEAFVNAEMSNYLKLAEANKMTLEELMSRISPQLIFKGEAERAFNNMQHGASYVVYSYGITFDQNEYHLTTPINYTIVGLPMPTMYPVTFDISYQKSGSSYSISVSPNDWNGYYHIQLIPDTSVYYVNKGDLPSEYIVRAMANDFFKRGRQAMSQGQNATTFLNSNCHKGDININITLQSSANHMVVIFAVESEDDAIPVMRSLPSIEYLN